MALSGTITGSTVGGGYRLEIDWSATQNISANTSTITAKVYWVSLGSSYTVSSSATKDGSTTIDGSTSSWSTSGCSLSGNQKKLVNTYTHTVTHNSDGTKSLTISAVYDVAVTLGSYVSSVSASGSVTLNTIPRASTLSSSANWTAGNDVSISISRASSSFTHTVEIYVNSVLIKTLTGVGTSSSSSFSTANNTTIFQQLNGGSSQDTKITLITYNGSDEIGSNSYTGTVTAPKASTGTISNPTGISETSGQENSTVYIDQTVTVSLTVANSAFTHTLNFKDGNSGAVVHSATGVTSSYSWTPSSSEKTSLYAQCPDSIEFDGQCDIITYYNGVQVQATYGMDINYRVRNSNPTFGTGYTYADINATTTAITGDASYIIQNNSTLQVTIPTTAFATAINGASMSSYNVTVNGVTKPATQGTSNIVLNFGAVNASTNQTLTVQAIDSRGNSTTTSITVKVLPYAAPIVTATATRLNNFEAQTTLTLKGSISTITTTAQKNALKAISGEAGPLEYRYAVSGQAYPSTWSQFTYTTSGGSYTATAVTLTLDNTESFTVEVRATDKLQTNTVTLSVSSGQPVFFIDTQLDAVGVNKFPANGHDLEVGGKGQVQLEGVYGTYLNDYMLNDHMNGNVTLSALGSDLYLGYKNTGKIRLATNLYDSGATKVIMQNDGTFPNGITTTGNSSVHFQGTDLNLGSTSNGTGRGAGGRAMVQQPNNQLVINYAGDFGGGVDIQGPKLTFGGHEVLASISSSYNAVQMGSYNFGSSAVTGSQFSHAITFPTAFASGTTPMVFLTVEHADSIKGYLSLQIAGTESSTGFTLYGAVWATMTTNYLINWIAYGQV